MSEHEPSASELHKFEAKPATDEELRQLAEDPDIDAIPDDNFSVKPGETVRGEMVAGAQPNYDKDAKLTLVSSPEEDQVASEHAIQQEALMAERKKLHPEVTHARDLLQKAGSEIHGNQPLTITREDIASIRATLDQLESRLDSEPPASAEHNDHLRAA